MKVKVLTLFSRRVQILVLDFKLNTHVKIGRAMKRINMENKVFRISRGNDGISKRRERERKKKLQSIKQLCLILSLPLSALLCALQGWPCMDHAQVPLLSELPVISANRGQSGRSEGERKGKAGHLLFSFIFIELQTSQGRPLQIYSFLSLFLSLFK